MPEKSITEKTLSGVKWTALESISVKGVTFLLGLLMARILSPSDFGTIGMLGIFIAISQTLIDSGFSNALIRKIDRTEVDCSTTFYFNIAVGVVCYLILALASPLIASFFKTPILEKILKVYAITLIFNSLAVVQSAKLTIELNFKTLARVNFSTSLFSGLIGLLLAYLGFGVWAIVWQSIAYSALRMILLWIIPKWKPLLVFSIESFKNLFSYGSKLLLSGLLHTIYSNFSTLAIGKFYTSQDLGYYSRGQSMASTPSGMITGILMRVTFPLFAQIQNDTERLIAVYRKYIKITSMVIFFCMILLAALAKPMIVLLITDKWLDSVIFVQIFCFALMFDHICQLNLNLLQVKGRSDLFLKLEIIKKAIAFAILCISIPLGVKAICISAVIYTQIAVFINTYYTGKLFSLGYITQVKDFSKYFLLSILACIPSYALTFSSLHPILVLIIGSAASFGLYILMLRKDPCLKDVLEIIKNKVSFLRK